jgi:hypothetical protein
LDDRQWAKVEALLKADRTVGEPGRDDRNFIEAVLWWRRTGVPWRDLPQEFGLCAARRSANGAWLCAARRSANGASPYQPSPTFADTRRFVCALWFSYLVAALLDYMK